MRSGLNSVGALIGILILLALVAGAVLLIWYAVKTIGGGGRRRHERLLEGARQASAAFDGSDVVRFPVSPRSGPTRAQVESAASDAGYGLSGERQVDGVTTLTFTRI